MQILLAAATSNEISVVNEWLEKTQNSHIRVRVTGIGAMATAYSLTKAIAEWRPDVVVQAGIGGSFSESLPPGSVALIGEEVTADLGALENGKLIDLFDMGFERSGQAPFTGRMLVNPWQSHFSFAGLPFVRGATVNAITSEPQQRLRVMEKYEPVIESMEGAALHYVCLKENIPFVQLRAVSNRVGERDKAKWKLRDSVAQLNESLQELLKVLLEKDDIN